MSIIPIPSEHSMKKQAGFYRRVIITGLMGFLFLVSYSQTVTVNSVIVKPPYKAQLNELADQIIAILTPTQNVSSASLYITIKGDNGISLRTNTSYLPGDIGLTAKVPNQLMGSDISEYFSATHLLSSGIPIKELANNGLPEGSYQLCIRVRNSDGGYISAEEPIGCSNYFTIRYSDPPMPVNPQCGSVISNSPVQNIMFTWTPPTSAPSFTSYTLRIVELLDSTQNPNAAMQSAKDPVFFETTVYGAFSFHYGLMQPLLESGRIYAWQVIAKEEETKTKFTNNGKSEVCWFKWLPAEQQSASVRSAKSPAPSSPVIQLTNVDPIPISTVGGILKYKFKDASAPLLNSISSDGLVYNQNNINTSNSEPLANVSISLVVTYVLSGSINNESYSANAINGDDLHIGGTGGSAFSTLCPDYEKVLATTTTKSDGSFSFMFVNTLEDLGLVNNNVNWTSNGGEFYDQIKGSLYKVIRLKVGDKYYCSPDINIKLDSWDALDLGTVVSYVKSYSLKVTTKVTSAQFYDIAGGSNRPIDKIKTTLRRNNIIDNVPVNEGGYSSTGSVTDHKDIVTKYSDENGEIVFTNLVQHDPDILYDKYWLFCEPDKNQGTYIFRKKLQSYYPNNYQEKKSFPYNDKYSEGYNTFGENITYNCDLNVKTYDMTIYLTPDNPRVAGRVETTDVNSKSMSNIKIVMFNDFNTTSEYDETVISATTDANGYYEFNNLEPEIDEVNVGETSTIVGPERLMICAEPEGYNTHSISLGILKYGQQLLDQDFILEPDGLFSGYVTDENGNPVAASVQIDDLAFSSTSMVIEKDNSVHLPQSGATTIHMPENTNTLNAANLPSNSIHLPSTTESAASSSGLPVVNTAAQLSAANMVNQSQGAVLSGVNVATVDPIDFGKIKQFFSFAAPSGSDRTLTIQPNDPGYSTETYAVIVPKASHADETEVKTYVVYKMKKRIRFRIVQKPSSNIYMLANLHAIPNTTVTLQMPGNNIQDVSDQQGYVSFEFESNGSSFTFDVEPPEEANYEQTSYTLNNVEDSKTMVTYDPAMVKSATKITGKVYLGDNQTVIDGASVYIEQGNGERIEATTASDGSYVLSKVPKSPSVVEVWASKPGVVPNISSQSQTITLDNDNQLDFTLKVDNTIAVADIYGFEVDIQDKVKQSDGSYLISGSLIDLPENLNFKPTESDMVIPFSNVKIKESGNFVSGIPIGVPDADHFNSDIASLSLILNNVFAVSQTPVTGQLLQISSENNKGQVKGKVGVSTTSFQYSDNYILFNEAIPFFLTSQPGNTQTNVVTLTVSDYPKNKFGIVGASGSDVIFKYLNFKAKADKSTSYLEENKIGLTTSISTNEITGMNPSVLTLSLGDLVLRPTGIDPISSSTPLSFKLENWDLVSTSWSVKQNTSGVNIPNGSIKTGLVDVPAKDMVITPDNFTVGEFEMQNLTFSGVTPLNIQDAYRSFGYNTAVGTDHQGHWELRIVGTGGNPAATIAGLPGMESGASLKFQKFSLLSNGEQDIVLGNQEQELVFYDVLKVKPLAFSGGDKYFDMQCNIDLDIPRIGEASGILRFSKSTGQLKTEVYPFNVSFEGQGGVKFNSSISYGDQKVDATGFTAVGTIKDAEGINLNGRLRRTTTNAWVEVYPTGQSMPLGTGQTSLSNVTGKMAVTPSANDWSDFTFSGDMKGFTGMDNHVRKTFTVYGDIVANSDTLGVKNIPTPIGGMNVTYDIQNARLTADFDIDQQVGAIHINGTTNMVIDAAGWYMLTGGLLTAPGMGTFGAGMLIGDYHQMASNVTQKLVEYSYNKNIPAAFQTGVSGFFFVGQKDVPIVNIPDFDINLGIISASLGLSVGMDARLWMSFSGSGNEYGIGAMAFAHAWLSASSITCTKLSADARAEVGVEGVYQTNTGVFTATGCGSFSIGCSIEQCFPTPCLSDGICCEYCGGISIGQGIKAMILLDSNGNTSLDFGFGNCSGQ
jgi:hypothetical protein